jgi:hypothetical protein
MNKLLSIATIFIVSILLCSKVSAQDGTYVEVRDLETWSSAGVKLNLDKRWEFGLSEQLRLKTNSSVVSSYFTAFKINYIGWKRWELGGGFRFLRDNDTKGGIQGFENHSRYHIELAYKHKINRFKLAYRLRFQRKNELGVSEDEGDYPNRYLRLKLGLGYNLKNWKLDPKFSTEIFRHYEQGEENGFDKIRWTIGTEYKMKKLGALKLFYRMERELNITYPKTTNIFGLSYVYTFKIKTDE